MYSILRCCCADGYSSTVRLRLSPSSEGETQFSVRLELGEGDCGAEGTRHREGGGDEGVWEEERRCRPNIEREPMKEY